MTRTDRPARRGRPPGTSARELESIALRLFAEHGFDGTTIDMIAAEAGTSGRTFFRYFDSKTSVLWRAFDDEVAALGRTLAGMPTDIPVIAAVRRAVVEVNHYRAKDMVELRTRMALIGSTPELAASATVHYDAWERAIAEYVAGRRRIPADSLVPLALARATLAACRAAYDRWVERDDTELTVYIEAAMQALGDGFADDALVGEPAASGAENKII